MIDACYCRRLRNVIVNVYLAMYMSTQLSEYTNSKIILQNPRLDTYNEGYLKLLFYRTFELF